MTSKNYPAKQMKYYEQGAKKSESIYLNTIWLRKLALLAKLERAYLDSYFAVRYRTSMDK